MATSLWSLLGEYKVVIPILQRDFAQGRQTAKVAVIRDRFLNALTEAFKDNVKPLELDFIYGYTKDNQNDTSKVIKSFVPLDGQQRLTTLFLLHWYIAVKENHLDEATGLLLNFSYETRHSSRVFCEQLVKFVPETIDKQISIIIINQPWFFTAWKNDPTISSMLTMLDAIQEKFVNIDDVWPLLTSVQPRIVFHLLPMDKLGLPDDLYIKMNSRGKELTEFEHFKSRFSEILNPDHELIFNNNIDQAWSDLFWDLYKDDEDKDIAKLVDNAFLRFFSYITDIINALNGSNNETKTDDFKILKQIYKNRENVDFLFSSLNIFRETYSINPDFFHSVFYREESDFNVNKTRLFFQNSSIDLFKNCTDNYDSEQRANPFSIGEQLLLYACIIHLKYNSPDFNNRVRKLRNLIANSEFTVRKENMPSLLVSVSEIILNNSLDEDSKFNKTQAVEEEAKHSFILQNIRLNETVYRLEDHHLLQGCLAIFKLEPDLNDFAAVFHKVFTVNCNYEMISMALLSFGDYSQKYDWKRRLGNHNNSVWRELFTPSQSRKDFNETQLVLYALFGHLIQNPDYSLELIIAFFLASFEDDENKPKDWKYYFIKYRGFRKNEDGFYTWWPKFDKPYECIMMRRGTLGGFNWSPFLYTIKEKSNIQLNLDNYNKPLILVKGNSSIRIFNVNNGYKLEASEDDSIKLLEDIQLAGIINKDNIFQISQNEDGMDLEDRIEKGIELVAKIINL